MTARALALALVALAVALGAAPAHAAGSFLGARTFDQGQGGYFATVGLPDIEIGGIIGLSSLSDVAPRLRLSYGHATRLGGFGLAAGAGLRLRVLALAGWQAAIVAGPELFLHAGAADHPPARSARTSLLGFGLGAPGLVASREVGPGMQAIVGLHAPLNVQLLPEPTLDVPVFLALGLEAELTVALVLLAQAELGAELYGPGGRPDSELYQRFRLGLGWR